MVISSVCLFFCLEDEQENEDREKEVKDRLGIGELCLSKSWFYMS